MYSIFLTECWYSKGSWNR